VTSDVVASFNNLGLPFEGLPIIVVIPHITYEFIHFILNITLM